MEIHLPANSTARPLTTVPEVMFVNVNAAGEYFVDGEQLTLAALEGMLQRKVIDVGPDQQQSVVIRADKECVWSHVVAVMNLCNKADITDYRVAMSVTE